MRGLVFYGATGKFTWRMAATVLGGQSLAVFFGALVARGIGQSSGDPSSGLYLWVGSALALSCILGAGLMRRPYGVTLGWLIQLATFLSAVVVPAMLLVGVIFAALWVTCLVQGHRIDTLQAKWAAERDSAEKDSAERDSTERDSAGRDSEAGASP